MIRCTVMFLTAPKNVSGHRYTIPQQKTNQDPSISATTFFTNLINMYSGQKRFYRSSLNMYISSIWRSYPPTILYRTNVSLIIIPPTRKRTWDVIRSSMCAPPTVRISKASFFLNKDTPITNRFLRGLLNSRLLFWKSCADRPIANFNSICAG